MFVINIEKLKTLKYHIFFKKTDLSIVCGKCGHEYKRKYLKFKEEELVEILKIPGLITNLENIIYKKIYNHD